MSQNLKQGFRNEGFWNGFAYSANYPIEFREIPETAKELYKGVLDLKKGEMDRKHTLGILVGGGLNLAATCLEIGVYAMLAVPYVAIKTARGKEE